MTPHSNYTMLDNYWKRPNGNFVRIPNSVLQDSNLSLSAKGGYMVLAYQAQNPNPDWLIRKEVIRSALPQNNKYTNAIKELMETGYLHRFQLSGQKFQYAYVLLNEPILPDPTGAPRQFKALPALRSYVQKTLGIGFEDGAQTHNYYHAPDDKSTAVPRQIIKEMRPREL
ncbi:Uncharacterised protein [uncultured Flavonifractor sp.]|nr:Uncharacterised protein [uncultured Flavonifractor sp.]